MKTTAASVRPAAKNRTVRGCRVLAATMRPIDKIRVDKMPLRKGCGQRPIPADIGRQWRMARIYFVISLIPPRHVARRSHHVVLFGNGIGFCGPTKATVCLVHVRLVVASGPRPLAARSQLPIVTPASAMMV